MARPFILYSLRCRCKLFGFVTARTVTAKLEHPLMQKRTSIRGCPDGRQAGSVNLIQRSCEPAPAIWRVDRGMFQGVLVTAGYLVAASYCPATLAGMRPRSLTGMPWAFAHARMPPLRSRAAAVRAGG